MVRIVAFFCALFWVLVVVGSSTPASEVLKLYDADANGKISMTELDALLSNVINDDEYRVEHCPNSTYIMMQAGLSATQEATTDAEINSLASSIMPCLSEASLTCASSALVTIHHHEEGEEEEGHEDEHHDEHEDEHHDEHDEHDHRILAEDGDEEGEKLECFAKGSTVDHHLELLEEGEVPSEEVTLTIGNKEYVCYSHHHGEENEEANNTEEFQGYDAATWGKALAAVLIVCLVSLIGALFLIKGKVRELKSEVMRSLFAISIGTLVSAVFLHILPEAAALAGGFDHNWQLSTTFIAGIFCSFLTELITHSYGNRDEFINELNHVDEDGNHHHESSSDEEDDDEEVGGVSHEAIMDLKKEDEQKEDVSTEKQIPSSTAVTNSISSIKPVAYNIIWGDAFHNFADGILIATAFTLCDDSLGWLVMSASILHEAPQELLDFVILVDAGLSEKKALLFNLLSSLTAVLGAIIVLGAGQISSYAQGYIIAFGSGILTFVALSELVPMLSHHHDVMNHEMNKDVGLREKITTFLYVIFGAVIIGLTLLHHPTCGDAHDH